MLHQARSYKQPGLAGFWPMRRNISTHLQMNKETTRAVMHEIHCESLIKVFFDLLHLEMI